MVKSSQQHSSTTESSVSDLPGRWRSGVVFIGATLVAASLIIGGRAVIGVRAAMVEDPVPEPPIAVSVIPVVAASGYDQTSHHVGLVEPGRQTDLAFEASGTLLQVLVAEGVKVRKGQPIARLDSRSLDAERRAQIASRNALLADLERAKLALERQRSLQSRDFAAAQSIDEASLLVTRTEALIEQADAFISAIAVSLDKTTLRAPFDAQIGAQAIDVGSTVNPGMPIASLLEWRAPMVRMGLPIESIRTLAKGSEQSVSVNGIRYPATVVSTRQDVSARTRTVDVRLQLDITGRPLPAFGQTAELTLQRWVDKPGYRVPVSALSEGESGLWSVLLSVPDEPGDTAGQVVREHVELLHTDGVVAYVAGDLPTEAGIIQAATHRVIAGQRVRNLLEQP